MYGLCGAVSVGKTEIARAIASNEKVAVQSLECSAAREIEDIDALTTLERIEEYHLALDGLEEVYKSASQEYIADYTPVDLLADFVNSMSTIGYDLDGSEDQTQEDLSIEYLSFVNRCFYVTDRYFDLIVLVQPAEDSFDIGDDVLNTLMRGLLTESGISAEVLTVKRSFVELEKRVMSITEAIHQARSQTFEKRVYKGVELH